MKQLPKRPSIQPTTPPLNITQKGPTGESIEVLNTLANVAQVDELFKTIIGQTHLDPAIVLKIQKLRKGACKAIANASIQRTANVDLITAELTKKKRSNRQKGKNYSYGCVLDMEVIQEREAYCKLRDVWKDLACIQPNLLGKTCKKISLPVKKVKKINNYTNSNEVRNC